ncbi:MAG: phosphotransacetylase family protein [Armatimonadota bacterium]|jgi:BioD-like phosphotransacetylase family protein
MISVYIASPEAYAGKTLTSVVLGKRWQSQGRKVGFFKPLGTLPDTADRRFADEDARFVARELGIEAPMSDLCPVLLGQQGCPTEAAAARSQVMAAHQRASSGKDIMLVVGSGSLLSRGAAMGLGGPAVADMLDAKVVLVARVESYLDLDGIVACQRALGHRLLGAIANRVPARLRDAVEHEVLPSLARFGVTILGILPEDAVLRSVGVRELVEAIGGEVLAGEAAVDELVESFVVGAMGVSAALRYFRQTPRKCVITGGDRSDIQLAALETPTRCLILTGGLEPSATVLARAHDLGIPVVLVQQDTLATVAIVEQLLGKLRVREPGKIAHAIDQFAAYLDLPLVDNLLGLS